MAKKRRKPSLVDRFIDGDGERCPVCNSNNINKQDVEPDFSDLDVTQRCRCCYCKCEWEVMYSITSVYITKKGRKVRRLRDDET